MAVLTPLMSVKNCEKDAISVGVPSVPICRLIFSAPAVLSYVNVNTSMLPSEELKIFPRSVARV